MDYSIHRRIANDDLSFDEAEDIEWERAEVETTEAVSMRGILVPSPDGIGELRTQPEQNDHCENYCKAGLLNCRRDAGNGSRCGLERARRDFNKMPILKDES